MNNKKKTKIKKSVPSLEKRKAVVASTPSPTPIVESTVYKRSYVFQIRLGLLVAVVVATITIVFTKTDIKSQLLSLKSRTYALYTQWQSKSTLQPIDISKIAYVGVYETVTKSIEKKPTVVIIDLRPARDYKKQHLKASYSVPYDDPLFVDRVQDIVKNNDGVLMGYSSASMQAEYAAAKLANKGTTVSVLKLGWNELFNLPQLWVPEHLWGTFTPSDWLDSQEK